MDPEDHGEGNPDELPLPGSAFEGEGHNRYFRTSIKKYNMYTMFSGVTLD